MTSQTILLQAAAATDAPPAWVNIVPFIAMFAVMWFLILRPQMKRQKEMQNKLGGLKKGDQVLTGGGLIARVIKVDEHYVDLELAANVKVKALKSTIADVITPGAIAPAND